MISWSGADHPRSRGEHAADTGFPASLVGPSPLARGTPARRGVREAGVRTIPARAGNTLSRPHRVTRGHGPSPLARGTRYADGGFNATQRTIPARAGNTRRCTRCCTACRDHPRSRGEHPTRSRCCVDVTGPSPLARGTRGRSDGRILRRRTIPARAGNTIRGRSIKCSRRDHPRSRGEHSGGDPDVSYAEGPSPLARGTRRIRGFSLWSAGTIPARAGNTQYPDRSAAESQDHPRSRGEHRQAPHPVMTIDGPSPLARGTQRRHGARTVAPGTIPARAGNTRPVRVARGRGQDHPRSRGEHTTIGQFR